MATPPCLPASSVGLILSVVVGVCVSWRSVHSATRAAQLTDTEQLLRERSHLENSDRLLDEVTRCAGATRRCSPRPHQCMPRRLFLSSLSLSLLYHCLSLSLSSVSLSSVFVLCLALFSPSPSPCPLSLHLAPVLDAPAIPRPMAVHSNAMETHRELQQQRRVFSVASSKLEQLGAMFPLANKVIGAITKKRSRDTQVSARAGCAGATQWRPPLPPPTSRLLRFVWAGVERGDRRLPFLHSVVGVLALKKASRRLGQQLAG